MEIPGPVRAAIEANPIAHVVTINPGGTPQISLAWIGLDGDDVVIGTMFDQAKLRNIRRDQRIAISFETGRTSPMGLNGYIVLHGRARLTDGGAPELLQRLARGYIGPDVDFPPYPNAPGGWVIHIAVDRISGSDDALAHH
jgi:PPOX class probable F420-dependent enzyme